MATDYSGRRGYRLFQPYCFNQEIREFLCAQDALLHRLCIGKRRVIEIGCGKAEHGTWAIRRNLQYLGIDPSMSYLIAAQQKLQRAGRGQFKLIHGGIDDAPALLRGEPDALMKASVALIPFNCLGNVPQVELAAVALAHLPVMHIVTIFHDSPNATRARKSYYKGAGYQARARRTREGICFSSGKGLHTVGFNAYFLRTLWLRAGLRPRIVKLGTVGLAVISTP